MKKTVRGGSMLTLHRETLRRLSAMDLASVMSAAEATTQVEVSIDANGEIGCRTQSGVVACATQGANEECLVTARCVSNNAHNKMGVCH
jgi:hypothetical protein